MRQGILLSVLLLFLASFSFSQSIVLTKNVARDHDTLSISLELENTLSTSFALGSSEFVLGLDTNFVDVKSARIISYYQSDANLSLAYDEWQILSNTDTIGFSLLLNLDNGIDLSSSIPTEAYIAGNSSRTLATIKLPIKACVPLLSVSWFKNDLENGDVTSWTDTDLSLLIGAISYDGTHDESLSVTPVFSKDTILCYDDDVILYASSSPEDSVFYTSTVAGALPLAGVDSIGVLLDTSMVGQHLFKVSNGVCEVTQAVQLSVTDIQASVDILEGEFLPDSVCYADTLVLSAGNSSGGRGDLGFTWTLADANDITDFIDQEQLKVMMSKSGTNQYAVEVKDAYGCFDEAAYSVFNTKPIIIDIISGDTTKMCVNPSSFIELDAQGSGGEPYQSSAVTPYKYQWTIEDPSLVLSSAGSDTTTSVFFITSGRAGQSSDVYFRVTDSLGCFSIDTTHLTLDTFSVSLTPKFDPICTDFDDSLTVDVLGGSGAYSVRWFGSEITDQSDEGALFNSPTEKIASVRVLVIDSLERSNFPGCKQIVDINIEVRNSSAEISTLAIGVVNDYSACEGDTVALSGLGSVGVYGKNLTYDWGILTGTTDDFIQPSDTLADTVYLAGGAFRSFSEIELIATDSVGCKNADTISVYWNAPLVLSLPSDTVYACNGNEIELNAGVPTGGSVTDVSEYVFDWEIVNSKSTTAKFLSTSNSNVITLEFVELYDTAIVAVSLFDSLSCFTTDTLIVIGTKLNTAASMANPSICTGVENQLQVDVVTPGNEFGPYDYAWYQGGILQVSTKDFSPVLLTEGSVEFQAVVEDQTTACTDTATVVYTVQDIRFTLLDDVIQAANAVCFQDSILGVISSVEGGDSLSYQYSWEEESIGLSLLTSNVNGDSVSISHTVLNTQDTLRYIALVEDKNTCLGTDTLSVIWNSEINIDLNADSVYSCNIDGGNLSVTTILGGRPDYFIEWSSKEDGVIDQGVGVVTTQVFLAENEQRVFSMKVTDEFGCTNVDSSVVTGVDFQIETSAKYDSICAGIEDTLYVSPIKGVKGNLSYSWSPNVNIDNVSVANPVVSPIQNGYYKVDVLDDKSLCTATDSVYISIYDVHAKIDLLEDSISCFGDAPIAMSGTNSAGGVHKNGSSKYEYTWSSDALGLLIDADGLGSVLVDTGNVFRGVTTQINLMISDSLGCQSQDSLSVIWDARIIVDIVNDTIIACSGGVIDLEANGASGGEVVSDYSYHWEASNLSLLINETSLNPSVDLQSTEDFTVTLTAEDDLGCTAVDSLFIQMEGIELEIGTVSKLDSVCFGVEDTLSANIVGNGVGPYEYTWSPAVFLDDDASDRPAVTITADQEFKLVITDLKTNCMAVDSITVEYYDPEVTITTLDPSGVNACSGQNEIQLEASTGYDTYQWSTVSTDISFSSDNLSATKVIDGSLSRPTSNQVIISATNTLGCVAKDSVELFWGGDLTASFPVYSGGNLITTGAGREIVSICENDTVTIEALGLQGFAPYSYSWSLPSTGVGFYLDGVNGNMVSVVNSLPNSQTNIELVITDSLGCVSQTVLSDSIFAETLSVNLSSMGADTLCDLATINLEAIPNVAYNYGVSEMFNYRWDNAGVYSTVNTKSETLAASQWFYVDVVDDITSCTARDSVYIEVQNLMINLATSISNSSVPQTSHIQLCYGNTISMNASSATGGQKPYVYEWLKDGLAYSSNSIITPSFTSAEIGFENSNLYSLKVTDANGCESDTTVRLSMNRELFAEAKERPENNLLPNTTDPSMCRNETLELGGITQSGSGGTNALSYDWANISTGDTLTSTFGSGNLERSSPNPLLYITGTSGLYTLELTVSDQAASYCKATDTVIIEVYEEPEANFNVANDTLIACEAVVNEIVVGDYTRYGLNPPTIEWYYNADAVPDASNAVVNPEGVNQAKYTNVAEGWYVASVEDLYTCKNSASVYVKAALQPRVSVQNLSGLLCNNTPVDLQALTNELFNNNEASITWSVVQGNGILSQEDSVETNYTPTADDQIVELEVIYSNICADSSALLELRISEAPLSNFTVSNDEPYVTEEIEYTNETDAINERYKWQIQVSEFEWLNYNTKDLPTTIPYDEKGEFTSYLVVTDTVTTCSDTAFLLLTVEVSKVVYVPNVLSPEANHEDNKVAKVYGEGISNTDFRFTIYNRWGELVYETTDFYEANTVGWNGAYSQSDQTQETGVFTYVLQGVFIDDEKFEKTGTITILR